MRITFKLTAVLTGLFCLVLVVRAFLDIRDVHELLEQELRSEQEKLGDVLALSLSELWTNDGPKAATAWLERADRNRRATEVRVVCLGATQEHCTTPRTNPSSVRATLNKRNVFQLQRGARADRRLLTYVPLFLSGNAPVALELERTLAPEWAFVIKSIRAQAVTTVLVILLFAIVAYWINRRLVAKPVQTLIEDVDRAIEGQAPGMPAVKDEPSELAHKLHKVAGRIRDLKDEAQTERQQKQELEHQLRHANRLASVGTLAAALIHDLGTPLNVISGRATMVESEEEAKAESRDNARIIREQSTRIATMIRELLSFARPDERHEKVSDAKALAAAHLDLVKPLARKANVKTKVADNSKPVSLAIESIPLRQVMNNFIMNAVQAMPDGGHLIVGTGHKRCSSPTNNDPEAEYGYLYVQDEGVGITDEQQSRLFEAFYTTKPIGEGSGLGLNVCRTIVEQHQGWIEVESTPGQGTRFTAFFPRGEAQ